MDFMIENCLYHQGKEAGTDYWSFWVRVFSPETGIHMTAGGFRYWPVKNTLAEPSKLKDAKANRWTTTVKVDPKLYQMIRQECMFKFNKAAYEVWKNGEAA
jgi:hypothetical protein